MGEDRQDRELRERIADAVRAGEKARPVPGKEAETLVKATGRLDRMLAEAEAQEQAEREAARAEEMQSLRAAAGRLERMLVCGRQKPAPGKGPRRESRVARPEAGGDE
jgi:hypothetical protein